MGFLFVLLLAAQTGGCFAGTIGLTQREFPYRGCLTSNGWREFEGHCYKMVGDFNGSPAPISDVRGSCSASGPLVLGELGPVPIAYLAGIESQEENDFIADVVAVGQRAWLGGYRAIVSGTFVWQLENIFTTRLFDSGTGFTNWKPNEPNDRRGDEDCIEINRGPPGKWNDLPCRRKLLGVCKCRIEKVAGVRVA